MQKLDVPSSDIAGCQMVLSFDAPNGSWQSGCKSNPSAGAAERIRHALRALLTLAPLLHTNYLCSYLTTTMADPTKAETEQVFKVLKAQKGNKVMRCIVTHGPSLTPRRCASIVKLGIRHGPV